MADGEEGKGPLMIRVKRCPESGWCGELTEMLSIRRGWLMGDTDTTFGATIRPAL